MNYHLFDEQTERLTFHKLERRYFHACLAFFLDSRSNRYWKSEVTNPYDLANEWFEKQQWRYENNKGAINLLIYKQTNQVVGWCGLIIQLVDGSEELEVAYSIIPAHWNNGHATEATKKCIEYAFENKLASSIISIIHEDNVESERVAIKNGLTVDTTTMHRNNPVNIFRITNSR